MLVTTQRRSWKGLTERAGQPQRWSWRGSLIPQPTATLELVIEGQPQRCGCYAIRAPRSERYSRAASPRRWRNWRSRPRSGTRFCGARESCAVCLPAAATAAVVLSASRTPRRSAGPASTPGEPRRTTGAAEPPASRRTKNSAARTSPREHRAALARAERRDDLSLGRRQIGGVVRSSRNRRCGPGAFGTQWAVDDEEVVGGVVAVAPGGRQFDLQFGQSVLYRVATTPPCRPSPIGTCRWRGSCAGHRLVRRGVEAASTRTSVMCAGRCSRPSPQGQARRPGRVRAAGRFHAPTAGRRSAVRRPRNSNRRRPASHRGRASSGRHSSGGSFDPRSSLALDSRP